MASNEKLLPCPFCGGTPVRLLASGDERDGYADRVTYTCKDCGCSRGARGDSGKGGYADNSTVEQRALERWNTRAAQPVAVEGMPERMPYPDPALYPDQPIHIATDAASVWNACLDVVQPLVAQLRAENSELRKFCEDAAKHYEKERDALRAEVARAVTALRGVVAVADRATVEFDAARAFIAKHGGQL